MNIVQKGVKVIASATHPSQFSPFFSPLTANCQLLLLFLLHLFHQYPTSMNTNDLMLSIWYRIILLHKTVFQARNKEEKLGPFCKSSRYNLGQGAAFSVDYSQTFQMQTFDATKNRNAEGQICFKESKLHGKILHLY